MMLTLLALLPAFGADLPSWEAMVTRDLDPHAARFTPEAWQVRLDALCDGGDDRACDVLGGSTTADWAATACAADAEPFACQADAWARADADPEGAFATFDTQCREGWLPACADAARATLEGRGTWQSRRRARQIAEAACAEGDPRSCLVLVDMDGRARPLAMAQLAREALAAGRAEAAVALAGFASDERSDEAQRLACVEGNGVACRQVARRVHEAALDDGELTEEAVADPEASEVPTDPLAPVDLSGFDEFDLLRRGCDLRDDDSCVIVALAGFDTGRLDRDATMDALETLCETVDRACTELGYLREGGTVRAFKDGEPQPLQSERIEQSLSGYFLDCYRDLVDRGVAVDGVAYDLHAWLDEVGEVRGATVRSDATDPTFDTCIAAELLGREYPAPVDATEILLEMGMNHEAVIQVRSRDTDVRTDVVMAVESLLIDKAAEADRCYLENGGSMWDRVFSLRKLVVRRDGTIEIGKLVESSGIEEADACVLDLVDGFALDPLDYSEKAELYLKFVVAYREPKRMGHHHGEAMDEDLYMDREFGESGEYDDTLDPL